MEPDKRPAFPAGGGAIQSQPVRSQPQPQQQLPAIVPVKEKCMNAKEAFVSWVDHEEDRTRRKERSNKIVDPAAPRVATLTQRAKHELAINARKFVDVYGRKLEVVGNAVIREIMNTFAPYEGKHYLVEGTIDDTDYVPEPAMRVLGGKFVSVRANVP